MISILIFGVSIIVFVRGLTTLFFLLSTLTWLKKQNRTFLKLPNKTPRIYIIIALLREQEKIVGTLDYFVKHFKNSNTHIVIATSQREYEKKFIGPSTQEVVADYISRKKLSKFIDIVDYPHGYGVKAHQVNFALKSIKDDDSYITIYDADSRPHPDTLKKVSRQVVQNTNAKVLLQSAIFINNYDIYSSEPLLKQYFLKASAILQTRWTLTHELPRLFRQSDESNWFLKKYAYAHVVGHGMFIETKLFKSLGGYPTGTITEDLFLGYLLRSKGIGIYPLPLLELADSPKSITGLWRQKYVWFWGPMKTFSYFKYVRNNVQRLNIKSLSIPLALTFQNFVSTIAWLLSSPMITLLLLSPLLTINIFLILFAYISVIVYGPLQYFIIANNFSRLKGFAGSNHSELNIGNKIGITLMSIPAIVFNSIPPYFSLYSEAKSIINKQVIYKPKTDD